MNRTHRVLSLLAFAVALCPAVAKAAATNVYGQDKIITDASGSRFYVTATDGQQHPIVPFNPTDVPPSLVNYPATPVPILTGGGLPARVMLDEQGYITPVKNQYGRTACTIFSSVGAIESEYLRQYGTSLDLSEEYVINMMNEDRAPDWTGGSIGEKLFVSAYYGVAPTSDWGYLPQGGMVINTYDLVFGVTPGSAQATALGQKVWTDPLTRDIANYALPIYPPQPSHHDAVYGPQLGGITKVALNGLDPTPLETLIAEGHPVAFGTSTGEWLQDPTTGVFTYANNGAPNDHAVLLIGYDHDLQQFRVKNSWGSGFGNDGIGTFTYQLVMNTISDPWYISSLRPPTPGSSGNGALRGFWIGELGGVPGVGVLHHAFQDQGYTVVESHDAGYFYGNDGSTATLEWVEGSDTSVTLTVTGSARIQSIELTSGPSGWSYTGLGTYNGWNVTATGSWCRTTAPASTSNLTPASYTATPADPYVYAGSACTPSEDMAVSSPPINPVRCEFGYRLCGKTCVKGTVCP